MKTLLVSTVVAEAMPQSLHVFGLLPPCNITSAAFPTLANKQLLAVGGYQQAPAIEQMPRNIILHFYSVLCRKCQNNKIIHKRSQGKRLATLIETPFLPDVPSGAGCF